MSQGNIIRNGRVAYFVRALRLPFISASVLPFVFGSMVSFPHVKAFPFTLGLAVVVFTHLSANLINDYADSKYGADWQDLRFYGFFGGSKLIQEQIFSQRFYAKMSLLFFLCSVLCAALLTIYLRTPVVPICYGICMFLAWAYSYKPLLLSYRALGEVVIFITFGPALVMGGYFIQTGIFPSVNSFLLSAPMGLLVAAILFANEVPDYASDMKAGKHTLVALTGPAKAYMGYYALVFFVFFFILLNIAVGNLGAFSFFSLACILFALRAGHILKVHYNDKLRLIESSRLTIMLQTTVSLVLILAVIV
ncbi:MAG: prenyltransferase [Candidatus Omnitrophota bacterium]|jgi:1,4-dihydroxy-2-naphthoate octaprenyltransferase|nr:MAG: prenyltransferase [Candidatus Omnitrophota bacterium]